VAESYLFHRADRLHSIQILLPIISAGFFITQLHPYLQTLDLPSSLTISYFLRTPVFTISSVSRRPPFPVPVSTISTHHPRLARSHPCLWPANDYRSFLQPEKRISYLKVLSLFASGPFSVQHRPTHNRSPGAAEPRTFLVSYRRTSHQRERRTTAAHPQP
jgi:hypothetical protein